MKRSAATRHQSVVANATSGPAAVERLDRDVLGLSGLTHVIWLEGINDLGAGTAPRPPKPRHPHAAEHIIADIRRRLATHQRGVKVYGATVCLHWAEQSGGGWTWSLRPSWRRATMAGRGSAPAWF